MPRVSFSKYRVQNVCMLFLFSAGYDCLSRFFCLGLLSGQALSEHFAGCIGEWMMRHKLLRLFALAALPLFHQGGSHLDYFLKMASLLRGKDGRQGSGTDA